MDPFSLDHIIIRSSARAPALSRLQPLGSLVRACAASPSDTLLKLPTQSPMSALAHTGVSPRTPSRLSGNGRRTFLFTLPLRCQRTSDEPRRDRRGGPDRSALARHAVLRRSDQWAWLELN